MDELKATVETLIDLDEPEALLSTLRSAAQRKSGPRWQALAKALHKAEVCLIMDEKPAPAEQPADAEAKAE
jgi:hypothetical protein